MPSEVGPVLGGIHFAGEGSRLEAAGHGCGVGEAPRQIKVGAMGSKLLDGVGVSTSRIGVRVWRQLGIFGAC